jgi:hypothetical protein
LTGKLSQFDRVRVNRSRKALSVLSRISFTQRIQIHLAKLLPFSRVFEQSDPGAKKLPSEFNSSPDG